MRTPELNVTFVLSELRVKKTEDSGGDEPYLWVLGFKIDADTVLPPSTHPLIPTLAVQTFVGAPHFTFIRGAASVDAGPNSWPIPTNLGTRSFRLRPAFLEIGGWFDGFGGIVCLLWDQDGFSPATSDAGQKAFNDVFGATLADQLNLLLNGDPGLDAALNKDAQGNPLPEPAGGFGLQARLDRLADPIGMTNVVKEITVRLRSAIEGPIREALIDAAGWDELIDPDDLLGAQVAVFTAAQLQSMQPIHLSFTEKGANYEVTGFASGSRVHKHRLVPSVLSVTRELVEVTAVEAIVCWFAPRTYLATTYRQATTTRFVVANLSGTDPLQVRWLLGGQLLEGASGTVAITLESSESMYSPPAASVAAKYPGGAGALVYAASGTTLDLTNAAGDGVFYGTVQAIVRYQGDPPLDGAADGPTMLDRGYELREDISIVTLEVLLSDDYLKDVERCMRTVEEIDRKRIPRNWGKAKIIPGDPPPTWDSLQKDLRQTALVEQSVTREVIGSPVGLGMGGDRSPEARLRSLQALREKGLISAAELQVARARIIAQL